MSNQKDDAALVINILKREMLKISDLSHPKEMIQYFLKQVREISEDELNELVDKMVK